jgi:dihydroorotase
MLIQGGTVLDPAQNLHDVRDIALASGRVTAIAEHLTAAPGDEVIDARGLYVTPGLIDLHVHVFPGASHYGIEPDPHCLGTGTTTVVDAGSAGALTFPAFRKYVIEVSQTRILPFLNIGATGMLKAAARLVPVRVVRNGVARPAGLQRPHVPPAPFSGRPR